MERIKAKENMSKGEQGLQNFVNLDTNKMTVLEIYSTKYYREWIIR